MFNLIFKVLNPLFVLLNFNWNITLLIYKYMINIQIQNGTNDEIDNVTFLHVRFWGMNFNKSLIVFNIFVNHNLIGLIIWIRLIKIFLLLPFLFFVLLNYRWNINWRKYGTKIMKLRMGRFLMLDSNVRVETI